MSVFYINYFFNIQKAHKQQLVLYKILQFNYFDYISKNACLRKSFSFALKFI